MFEKKSVSFYILVIALIGIAAYTGNYYKTWVGSENYKDEYALVREYLLNDSPLYGYNRPKIWIHSKYEINARKWGNFHSRNTTDLNQPYLFLTIQSVINHCGTNFHICLIDDDTFEKLIPTWDIDIHSLAEPLKSQTRDIAMLQLVYYYGGMIVPNSFLCTKNLVDIFERGTLSDKCFVVENHNRSCNLVKEKKVSRFIPDIKMMGAKKNNETIRNCIDFLKHRISHPGHFSQDGEFQGVVSYWLQDYINKDNIQLIDGEAIGIKNTHKKPILLEDLIEEKYLDVNATNLYGIQIPSEDILKRTKYQWFAILPEKDILESRMAISTYFKTSIVDSVDEYHRSVEIKSILGI